MCVFLQEKYSYAKGIVSSIIYSYISYHENKTFTLRFITFMNIYIHIYYI